MRSKAIVVVIALSTALALLSATPDEKTKSSGAKPVGTKKTAAKTSPAKSKSKGTKSATGKKSGKQTSAKQSTSKQAAGYRRSAQKEPVPERYQEIQQSLADKGYFAGPVNGTWGPDSVEALKRFQRDQNIGDDGKLGSLSLIALGLGPKRGAGGAAEKPANPEIGGPSPP